VNPGKLEKAMLAKHFVVPEPMMEEALEKIEAEMKEKLGGSRK
jgi:excinuclease UvrABC helicase subunit UvrB